ncbi:MAG: hypothetical protein HY996_10040 [Micrococcales bacterium]|nr:hypothetical protein [Micrococcales bacterium]
MSVRAAVSVHDEEGSILPLIAVFTALAVALVLVVSAATSLYLERKRLYSIADGAALAGAESFPIEGGLAAGEVPRPRLTDASVAAAARGYLDIASTSRVEQLRLEGAGTDDGRTARVSLSGWWRPPVVTLFVPDGIRLQVTTTARSVFR